MDRTGTFAAAASLVLLSALHMLNAPNYLNVIPALLLGAALIRLWIARPDRGETGEADIAMTPAAEA